MAQKFCELTEMYDDTPSTSIILEMPVELLEQVKKAASMENSDFRTLIVCYVQNGLRRSQPRIRRRQFAEHVREVLDDHGIHGDVDTEIDTRLLF